MKDIRVQLIEEMTPDEQFQRVVEILVAASIRLLNKQKSGGQREADSNKKRLAFRKERR